MLSTGVSIETKLTLLVLADAETGLFCIVVNQLAPSQMRQTVKVTIFKGEEQVSHAITYSIDSYVSDVINGTGYSAELVDAVKAMMKYGDAIAAYKAASSNK